MSSSYSKDAQFLRDLDNAKKQKKLDQKILKDISAIDNKIFYLKEKHESSLARHKSGIDALETQIGQIKSKINMEKLKFKLKKFRLVQSQKNLNEQIKTESLKREFEEDETSESETESINLSTSDSESESESEVTNQVIIPPENPLEERKKLANARRQELREQGKPHIECIIWDEFPDVYQAEKEEEEKEQEAYKKSPEYLARQAEAEREREEAKQVKLEIQRQFREADKKIKTALQNIKDAKLKKKSEHEIQGLKLVLQTAENEFAVLKMKHPFA